MKKAAAAQRKPTLKDLAEQAGVSVGTASNVMAGRGGPSAVTVTHVFEVARKIGYVANAAARSLRSRRSRLVACLVPDITNRFYGVIVRAAEHVLREAGYTLLLVDTHNDTERECELLLDVTRVGVDGVLFAPGSESSAKLQQQIAQVDVPLVILDRDIAPDRPSVKVDHFSGALKTANYLLDLGHRRIALLFPSSHLRPARERWHAFETAAAARGIGDALELVRIDTSSMDIAFSQCLALFQQAAPPTAIFGLGTTLLAGALKAARQTGRDIPGDLSVVCVGDTELAQVHTPELTTLTWSLQDLGRHAARLLLAEMEPGLEPQSSPDATGHLMLTCELILRDSCAAVDAQGRRKAARGRAKTSAS
ncbi:LacI family DNA-binding transcriptional regulator [Cupriavidus sp. 8B]